MVVLPPPLTLRQADQARPHVAEITDDLDFIKAQLARIPTRKELARNTLGIIFATAAIVILLEMLARSYLFGRPMLGIW